MDTHSDWESQLDRERAELQAEVDRLRGIEARAWEVRTGRTASEVEREAARYILGEDR